MIPNDISTITDHQFQHDDAIMVSIVVATYNHEQYIAEALDSFLIQKTNFRVEILVNDDASTDTTAQIVKKYEEKYPHLFISFYQTVNQYSQGKRPWFNVLFPAARGKYIALCEGDDYWTDPLKLQKQVDFLEANLSFTICLTNTLMINEHNNIIKTNKIPFNVLKFNNLIQQNVIGASTCTAVFRKSVINDTDLIKIKLAPFGDWPLWLSCLESGDGIILEDICGCYRIHSNGAWNSLTVKNKNAQTLKMYNYIKINYPETYQIVNLNITSFKIKNEKIIFIRSILRAKLKLYKIIYRIGFTSYK